jgi:hypothetical protein
MSILVVSGFLVVYDAYIHSNGSVYIIDISPFHEEHSEPILWTWEELNEMAEALEVAAVGNGVQASLPPIRIIEEETNIMPNLRKMATALPFDLIQPEESGEDGEEERGLDGMDPNNIDALVEKLKNITAAAEKLNQGGD